MNAPQAEGRMASHIERRKFLATLGGAVATWPLGVLAQVSTRRSLVAVLSAASPATASRYVSGFAERIQELGYIAGRDIDIVHRYAAGDVARLPALVDELVRLKPDILIAANTHHGPLEQSVCFAFYLIDRAVRRRCLQLVETDRVDVSSALVPNFVAVEILAPGDNCCLKIVAA